jgi:hypothetical protein
MRTKSYCSSIRIGTDACSDLQTDLLWRYRQSCKDPWETATAVASVEQVLSNRHGPERGRRITGSKLVPHASTSH